MIKTTKNKTVKYLKLIVSYPVRIFVNIFSTIIGLALAIILSLCIFSIVGLVISYNILEPNTMNTMIYDSINDITVINTVSIMPIIESLTYILTESTIVIDQIQDILIQYYESNDHKIQNIIESII